jgi:hypothetical protein
LRTPRRLPAFHPILLSNSVGWAGSWAITVAALLVLVVASRQVQKRRNPPPVDAVPTAHGIAASSAVRGRSWRAPWSSGSVPPRSCWSAAGHGASPARSGSEGRSSSGCSGLILSPGQAGGCNIGAYLGGVSQGSLSGWAWAAIAQAGTWAGLCVRPLFGLMNPKPTGSIC